MTETKWVELMKDEIDRAALGHDKSLSIDIGRKIPYGFEILSYHNDDIEQSRIQFETDLVIIETNKDGQWKPRVVIEAKVRSINTHDAITYSQKAASHKSVHPYLRYGIMLGERKHYPLPGRLYRHGLHFDFMMSFVAAESTAAEMLKFSDVIRAEVEASRKLEEILYESRTKKRDHYTMLHRRLTLE